MKVPLVAASFYAGVNAVERCPLFAEKGWKLVRRTTDDSFSNGDLMAGTMVSGITHQLMKGLDTKISKAKRKIWPTLNNGQF